MESMEMVMRFAMRFCQGDQTLFRFVSDEISDEGIVKAHTEGMRQFREEFPDVFLFQGNLTVGYEKA